MLRWCTGSDFDYVFADVADNIRDIEEEDVLYVTGQMKNGCKFLLDPSWSRLEEKLKRPGPGWEILPKRMEVNQPKINLQWHRQTVEAMVRCYDSIASGEPVYMNK